MSKLSPLGPVTSLQVHQLYETIQRWSPIASTLPELVQRLVTIKQLHEQAMQFSQLLTHLDTTQQMITSSLKDNATLLTQVCTFIGLLPPFFSTQTGSPALSQRVLP